MFDHDILRHAQSQTEGFDELISIHENWILQSSIYSQMASSGCLCVTPLPNQVLNIMIQGSDGQFIGPDWYRCRL
jgi:hypothetical protein